VELEEGFKPALDAAEGAQKRRRQRAACEAGSDVRCFFPFLLCREFAKMGMHRLGRYAYSLVDSVSANNAFLVWMKLKGAPMCLLLSCIQSQMVLLAEAL
jgi:hypothetical protein